MTPITTKKYQWLEPLFQFFIMANSNIPFPSTLQKPGTQFRGISNLEYYSRKDFGGARDNFLIFHNGSCHFSISVDTQKTEDQNFKEVGNCEFCSRFSTRPSVKFCTRFSTRFSALDIGVGHYEKLEKWL